MRYMNALEQEQWEQDYEEARNSSEFREALEQWRNKWKHLKREPDCERCEDSGELSNGDVCPDCCPHDETDSYYCLECGKNVMDDAIGRAEMLEDR